MKNIISKKYITYLLFVLGGLFLGWLLFYPSHKTVTPREEKIHESIAEVWTCAMHPQIRKDKPGKCPICGMDLIPLVKSDTPLDPDAIHLSKDAAALANVGTSTVTKHKPVKEVRLFGKIQADERLLQSQVAQIPGRIEKLMVNFTGEFVRKGQMLALVWSPELVTARQELREAAVTKQSQPEIYQAVLDKLRRLKLTDSQILQMESTGEEQNNFEIVSTTTGIVTARRVNNGDYIAQGTVLYDIADLSRVWVMFDAYESDLPFLKEGDKISFSVEAIPGTDFSGNIMFIDPVIDPVTRVSKVRIEIGNPSGRLKPEMFVTGTVNANLSAFDDNIVIPRSAVLWTGKRSVVYVRQTGTEEPVFKIREIELGPSLGNSFVVISGLSEGEEIVTRGTFSIDAAAQLEGKPSMMNREGKTGGYGQNPDPGELPVTKDKISDPEMKRQMDQGNSGQDKSQGLKKAEFLVSGNCEMCKDRIEAAAKSVKGVTDAVWNMKTKILKLEYNGKGTNPDAVQKVIAGAGHDTGIYKADDAVYNSLPDCCLYRQ